MEFLKLAIQKKGRLNEKSSSLLKDCGIGFVNGINTLKTSAVNFPMEVLSLRDDDIPMYVADGVADIGIVGENEVLEKGCDVRVVKKLGFSKCRMSIAVPKDFDYKSIKDLDGKNIATSYPKVLEGYLKSVGVKADIHEITGSVEIAPNIGLAEAIFDIVSTGSTLFLNGLKEVEIAVKSEAVLIANKNLSEQQLAILDKLIFRIESLQNAKNRKYILLNAPNENVEKICNILPGMKSPTIMPLQEEGWCSLHSVIDENRFWDIIEELKANGAQGILITPVEKMIL